jgi:DNA (cytosine-5)-methyltransferase 1
MKHGSLFSGIGGFDLASEWMGWENVFHCEWNEFGKKVLHHYWPNAESFDDITKTDFTKYANKIDILTGGFPCQPYSMAGKRQGKEDERHLWPQMLRAIREIKPKYIVGENVFGLLNWNGGMVFDEVHSDLELEGYEVQAVVIPAAAVNAPHGRDRVWFVASHTNSRGLEGSTEGGRNGINVEWESKFGIITNTQFKSQGSDGGTNDETEGNIWRGNEGNVFGTLRGDGYVTNPKSSGSPIGKLGKSETKQQVQTRGDIDGFESLGIITDTNGNDGRSTNRKSGCEESKTNGKGEQSVHIGISPTSNEGDVADTRSIRFQRKGKSTELEGGRFSFNNPQNNKTTWDNFPTQSPICGGDDGLPTELDGITFSKWRNESIKAYGNAIVPQVAYQIFKAIQETI